jgi:hypothetical protein
MNKNMKLIVIFVVSLAFLFEHSNAQSQDSILNLNWKPYGILRNINERPLFTLDTNGFTFQFGYNSVLNNIYEYYHKNKNIMEDSLLLVFVKSIKETYSEINVNKLEKDIKKRVIRHFGDLMSKGNCKIIRNKDKEIITRIACLGYMNRDENTGGIMFKLLSKTKVWEDILQIETE